MLGAILGGLAAGVGGSLFRGGRKSTAPAGTPDAENSIRSGFGQFSDLGAGWGEALSEAMTQRVSNAFLGLPQPGDAAERGAMLRAFNQAAYPGTNAWEQLGATGGGAAAGSNPQNIEIMKLKTQERIAEKQIAGASAVARINAEATIAAAGGADNKAALVEAQATTEWARRDLVEVEISKVRSEAARNMAQELTLGAQTEKLKQEAEALKAQTGVNIQRARHEMSLADMAAALAKHSDRLALAKLTSAEWNSALVAFVRSYKHLPFMADLTPEQAVAVAVGALGVVGGASAVSSIFRNFTIGGAARGVGTAARRRPLPPFRAPPSIMWQRPSGVPGINNGALFR